MNLAFDSCVDKPMNIGDYSQINDFFFFVREIREKNMDVEF